MTNPMTMVERVARAYEPGLWRQIDADLKVRVRVGAAEKAKAVSLKNAATAIAAMREPTEAMEDAARGAWMWYAGLHGGNKWTLGQQNEAGGYKLSLTPEEAACTHLPKHIMGRISWRTQIDAALSEHKTQTRKG